MSNNKKVPTGSYIYIYVAVQQAKEVSNMSLKLIKFQNAKTIRLSCEPFPEYIYENVSYVWIKTEKVVSKYWILYLNFFCICILYKATCCKMCFYLLYIFQLQKHVASTSERYTLTCPLHLLPRRAFALLTPQAVFVGTQETLPARTLCVSGRCTLLSIPCW